MADNVTLATEPDLPRILGAEFLGTLILMLLGPGAAILALDAIGAFGVALSFGFALMIMAYAIGHISGCHINPAVTLGFLVSGKLPLQRAIGYWVAQVLGGIAGGLILFIITSGGDNDKTANFAANGWGDKLGVPFGMGAAILVEIIFTAILIFVVLSTTTKGFLVGFGPLAAGITLAAIHLVTIPVDNTSVNPARSIGAAVFSGGDAMSQLWVFILWPMVGGLLGAAVWAFIHKERFDLSAVTKG